jgi:hypothetical protein
MPPVQPQRLQLLPSRRPIGIAGMPVIAVYPYSTATKGGD